MRSVMRRKIDASPAPKNPAMPHMSGFRGLPAHDVADAIDRLVLRFVIRAVEHLGQQSHENAERADGAQKYAKQRQRGLNQGCGCEEFQPKRPDSREDAEQNAQETESAE